MKRYIDNINLHKEGNRAKPPIGRWVSIGSVTVLAQ